VGPSKADRTDGPEAGGPLSEQFVTWVAGAQRPLYAYIRSLVGPWAEPEDVLQEVNLVLCRKAHEFDGRGRFLTWACRVAYFQVLAYLKRRQRDKHLYLDEALLADLAGPLAAQVEQLDPRLEALRHCLGQLAPRHRRMVTARYARGGSVQAVAEREGRPAGSVRVTLHRIRLLLLACIERTVAKGSA
jgi:RNA polymerase sigma-70 factor, ECF subfamily